MCLIGERALTFGISSLGTRRGVKDSNAGLWIPPRNEAMAGFEMLGYMSGPLLGNALLGFLADLIGIQTALFCGAFCSLVLLIVFNYRSRSLWNYRKVT